MHAASPHGALRAQFDLSCKDGAGKAQKLSFVLREDIIPADSSCKTVRGEEVCALTKKHEHFWDRLPHDEKALEGLKQDWSKWMNAAEDESPSDAPYSSPSESAAVKTVDAEQYAKILKESAAVYIDASLPWCTKCTFTRKGFAAAAKQLGGDKTPFGKAKPISFVYIDTGLVPCRNVPHNVAMYRATVCARKTPRTRTQHTNIASCCIDTWTERHTTLIHSQKNTRTH